MDGACVKLGMSLWTTWCRLDLSVDGILTQTKNNHAFDTERLRVYHAAVGLWDWHDQGFLMGSTASPLSPDSSDYWR